MMTQPVVVVGVGMVTAVGLSARETAASVRTATARFSETAIRDHRFEPFVVAEVPDAALAGDDQSLDPHGRTSRESRMLRLARLALAECVAALPEMKKRPGLILSMPEMGTTLPLNPSGFLSWLNDQSKGSFDLARSDASFLGRAGGLLAIQRAFEFIQSGQADVMIAGGVDSMRDPYILGTLDLEKRVKSTAHLDGFIPGEAAGFLAIASERGAERAELGRLAKLSPVVDGFEEGHLYSNGPYRGDGLALTVRRLVESGAVSTPLCEVYSSMNGESHWAKEWGVSYVRNREAFTQDHGLHHPADCFGDTGAACGPLMVGLAAIGIARGYHDGPALVYCSSDAGARAALVVGGA